MIAAHVTRIPGRIRSKWMTDSFCSPVWKGLKFLLLSVRFVTELVLLVAFLLYAVMVLERRWQRPRIIQSVMQFQLVVCVRLVMPFQLVMQFQLLIHRMPFQLLTHRMPFQLLIHRTHIQLRMPFQLLTHRTHIQLRIHHMHVLFLTPMHAQLILYRAH